MAKALRIVLSVAILTVFLFITYCITLLIREYLASIISVYLLGL